METSMKELYAQGDLLIERVADRVSKGAASATECSVVLAEGELTGHNHTAMGRIAFFRDDGLARDIPDNLYIGHLSIEAPSAKVVHQEHAAIDLPAGTYRVRRQRELDPAEARVVSD
jgi:hypothetical protein